MSCLQSAELAVWLSNRWSAFQRWRALRMLRRVVRIKDEAETLYAEATELLAVHAPPPLPLFDRKRQK